MKYSLIFFLLTMATSAAQETYKLAEGFYNTSSFEVASGTFLLEDKTFFSYASFGNVDLKVFGLYTISKKNRISFKMDEDLLKEFHFYGLKNEIQKENITFHYGKPYAQRAEQLFLIADNQRWEFPRFIDGLDVVILTIPTCSNKTIEVGYRNPEDLINPNSETTTQIQLNNGFNEIKVYHNYYAEMNLQMSEMTFVFKDGTLTDLDAYEPKTYQREVMNPKVKKEVVDYLQELTQRQVLVKDGKIYQQMKD